LCSYPHYLSPDDYLWNEHDMDQLLVLSITIPTLQPNEVFQTYRAAIRQNSAHALLNAAFRVTLSDGVITDATLVYGLAQDRAVFATEAETALKGKPLDVATLSNALDALDSFEMIVESHYKTARNHTADR
jgi:xanthine dehydrogenase iron-sulfur cluster and FAD-binding subunit A